MILKQIEIAQTEVEELAKQAADELDLRDQAGINKILFELNLLKGKFPEKKKTSKRTLQDAPNPEGRDGMG